MRGRAKAIACVRRAAHEQRAAAARNTRRPPNGPVDAPIDASIAAPSHAPGPHPCRRVRAPRLGNEAARPDRGPPAPPLARRRRIFTAGRDAPPAQPSVGAPSGERRAAWLA
ncbi:hypothetical protein SZ29_30875 [Burkholderia pseudomallei]|nr:hypothetical protein SZ29_30875 [Burkholderia pseudomallei]